MGNYPKAITNKDNNVIKDKNKSYISKIKFPVL